MAIFSVVIVTAAPPGQAAEAGGAFVKIDQREALLRSIELFVNRDPIKQMQLVVNHDAAEEVKRKHGGHLSFSGVKLVIAGDAWTDQLAAAADKISDETTHVLVHDAARPAVAYTDLEALMEQAEHHPAVALVCPTRATLIELDEGGGPMAYHRPEGFMQLLTPQAYSKSKFLEMARSRQPVHASQLTLLKGSPLNIRLSGSGDASLARAMINMLPKPKVRAPSSPFEEAQW